jgi:hypothetical protein
MGCAENAKPVMKYGKRQGALRRVAVKPLFPEYPHISMLSIAQLQMPLIYPLFEKNQKISIFLIFRM